MERACCRHTSHFFQEPAWTAGKRRTCELAALSWQATIPADVFCPAESWQKNLPSQMPSRITLFSVSLGGFVLTPMLPGCPDPTTAVPVLQPGTQEAVWLQSSPLRLSLSLLCGHILMRQGSSSGQNSGPV